MPRTGPQTGQILELQISSLAPGGEGIAEQDGCLIRVRDALPGERVRVRITARSRQRPEAFGQLLAVSRPSGERVAAACAQFGRCGGCDLQHLAYPAQLSEKQGLVARALGAYPALAGVEVLSCEESPGTFGYRYVAKWLPRWERGRVILGAYARRSHEVVSTGGCPVHRPPLEAVGRALVEELSRLPGLALGELPPGSGAAGLLRYLVARESRATGEIALILVAPGPFPREAELAERLGERLSLAGVIRHENAREGDAIFDPAGEDVVLYGEGALLERVGPVLVPISPRAFLQINAPQAERMQEEALALAEPRPGEVAVDLYAGAGGLSLRLAKRVGRVISIERSREAVAVARLAAQRAGAGNLELREGDAAEMLRGLERADLVLLNPPRAGASAEVLRAVAALSPSRLIYTSCSPKTFARDAALLVEAGFRLERLRPFDLFPQTAHVEILARFFGPGR